MGEGKAADHHHQPGHVNKRACSARPAAIEAARPEPRQERHRKRGQCQQAPRELDQLHQGQHVPKRLRNGHHRQQRQHCHPRQEEGNQSPAPVLLRTRIPLRPLQPLCVSPRTAPGPPRGRPAGRSGCPAGSSSRRSVPARVAVTPARQPGLARIHEMQPVAVLSFTHCHCATPPRSSSIGTKKMHDSSPARARPPPSSRPPAERRTTPPEPSPSSARRAALAPRPARRAGPAARRSAGQTSAWTRCGTTAAGQRGPR